MPPPKRPAISTASSRAKKPTEWKSQPLPPPTSTGRTNNASASTEKASKKPKKSGTKVVQKREGKTRTKNLVDIFNEHALINAYHTCHNVQDLLKNRGFPWPELTKKKRKSKK